jgi:tetratricopeptide (TPR) repeat protein
LGCLAFTPGLNGPFVFDDYTNLLSNTYVKLDSLDPSSLYQASFSLTAGPLQRPLSMLTFAVNHALAGGFGNAFPFKIVNLFLHFINGVLIFWLTRLVLARIAENTPGPNTLADPSVRFWIAGLAAFLWVSHPIQLTGVLYVVQRMTELSALFVLAGLISYLHGRARLRSGEIVKGLLIILIGLCVFWPLGLYSKENALLYPIFVLALEFYFFADDVPWNRWLRLSTRQKTVILTFGAGALLLTTIAAVRYALPGYGLRDFTMGERLLTEARVLVIYLSLILAPRTNTLGLFHDDIVLSTSWLSPWTTLPAILTLLALISTAVILRRKHTLLGFGIAWFFVGHLLESTFFPLEIAHEHRNYLASYGVLLALTYLIMLTLGRIGMSRVYASLLALGLLFGSATVIRASQWSDGDTLRYYEAYHHPDSTASQAMYVNLLLRQGKFDEAMETVRRISRLSPQEPGYLISAQMIIVARGGQVSEEDNREISRRLSSGTISVVTENVMADVAGCILDRCRALQPYMETWIRQLLSNPKRRDISYYHFVLGRVLAGQGKLNEAIEAYRQAYDIDPKMFHPLLDLADLYLALGMPDSAEAITAEIQRLNDRSELKRDKELARLRERIEATRRALTPGR